jgi:hypothetical protein
MAAYHFSAQIIKRSQGRSIVRFAAYRAGAKLLDERSGRISDFSHRQGVAHAEIIAPEGCAPWLSNRESLWNAVERAEKRSDAQLAREINMALPHELTDGQRLRLVRDFVSAHFTRRGMVADIAIHRPRPGKGDDCRNHHAHVTLTLRQATRSGLRAVKTRQWNSNKLLQRWRREWADWQNAMLKAHGHKVQVDDRRLVEQRRLARERGDMAAAEVLDRLPELHVGPHATNAARRGLELQGQDRQRPGQEPPRFLTASAESRRASHSSFTQTWPARVPRLRDLRFREVHAGSRYRANQQRIAYNLAAIDRKIAYWVTRTARERMQHQRLMRRIHERQMAQRYRQGASTPLALSVPAMSMNRPGQARTRPGLLIRQLEALLSSLLAQKWRHATRWAQLEWPFKLARRRPHRSGRGRSRSRTAS